jgi:PBP1b-binding outer membrane lipoprotein LpoB
MRKSMRLIILFICILFLSGCVEKKIDTSILDTPDKKALYDLMIVRIKAMNETDLSLFKKIYIENSPELEWIEKTGIPMWQRNGMHFKIMSFEKFSILGEDAAARFILTGRNNQGTQFILNVEALYVKQGNQWKFESTGER